MRRIGNDMLSDVTDDGRINVRLASDGATVIGRMPDDTHVSTRPVPSVARSRRGIANAAARVVHEIEGVRAALRRRRRLLDEVAQQAGRGGMIARLRALAPRDVYVDDLGDNGGVRVSVAMLSPNDAEVVVRAIAGADA